MTGLAMLSTSCLLFLIGAIAGAQAPAAQSPGAAVAAPQASAPASPARAEVIAAARAIAGKARYASMVTLDTEGVPQARVVDPFPPEDDLTVWIATTGRSRKVAQLTANDAVTLLYFDRAGESYVTMIGTATLVRDPAEKARHWKDEWKAFYRDGPRGEDYVLIRVVPRRLEVVGEAYGMPSDPETWRPVILDLRR